MLANVFPNLVAFENKPGNRSLQNIDLGIECVNLILAIRDGIVDEWDLGVERNVVACQ
jgi:hypothetical protein